MPMSAEKHRIYVKNWTFLKKYGLSREQLEALFEQQDYSCGLCGIDLIDSKYHVDHDHNCCPGQVTCGKCVRSLLCHTCNLGLGFFKDDPEQLRRAAAYIERYARGEVSRV